MSGHATTRHASPASVTSCFAFTHRHHGRAIVPFAATVNMSACESVTRLVSFGAQAPSGGANVMCHSRHTRASIFSCGRLAMYPLNMIVVPSRIAVPSRIMRTGPIGNMLILLTGSILRRFLGGSILRRIEQMHCPMYLYFYPAAHFI